MQITPMTMLITGQEVRKLKQKGSFSNLQTGPYTAGGGQGATAQQLYLRFLE